jgi:hypothetical protein
MMYAEMDERSQPGIMERDPWRRRMGRTAERLRRLDENFFKRQIALIDEVLYRDATWDLQAALTCNQRWRCYSNAGATAESA